MKYLLFSLFTITTLSLNAFAMEERKNTEADAEVKTAEAKTAEAVEEWGTIRGKIVVDGKVPEPENFTATSDAAVCGATTPMKKNDLIVDKDGGLKNVFFYLYQGRRDPQTPDVHPSYDADKGAKILVDNLNCMFEPHVMFIRSSQTLVAKNSDTVGHNVKMTTRENDISLAVPANDKIEQQLKPEKRPAGVACAAHPWMKGYILVRDEPYVAISNETGDFEIKNMPDGEWVFQFWHERGAYLKNLKKADGSDALTKYKITVTVEKGKVTDLGTLTISADDLKED